MRPIVLVLALALAGCSTTTVTATSGGTSAQGGVYVQAQVNSRSLAAVILAGMLLGAALEDARNERPFPSLSDFFADWMGTNRAAPELLPGRHISEQDCTRPVDPYAGNLRCR
jgi:hypothetical protein